MIGDLTKQQSGSSRWSEVGKGWRGKGNQKIKGEGSVMRVHIQWLVSKEPSAAATSSHTEDIAAHAELQCM